MNVLFVVVLLSHFDDFMTVVLSLVLDLVMIFSLKPRPQPDEDFIIFFVIFGFFHFRHFIPPRPKIVRSDLEEIICLLLFHRKYFLFILDLSRYILTFQLRMEKKCSLIFP